VPKTYLLTGAQLRSLKTQRRLHGEFFSLATAPISGARHAKCAVIVSKKVSLKAADRNLVKRRARAALSSLLPALPPIACIFTAKKGAAGAPYASIKVDLERLLSHLS
jgi:ribonuclease P protein component